MMDTNTDATEPSQGRPPLGVIGIIIALVLLIPTVLFYSIAPDEPLKAGVTIFSDGRQRAYLADPSRSKGPAIRTIASSSHGIN
nr:hypothetical protein [Nitrospirota bacterium]